MERYVMKDFSLSEEEVAEFSKNGYIGPFVLYDQAEMKQRWHKIRYELTDRSHAIYPDLDAYSGANNIANYDRHLDIDLLSEHICRQEIVDRVVSILGPDVLCWRTEFFPKHKGDEGTDWHQAATFANASGTPQILWPKDDMEKAGGLGGTLTIWTALTDSTLENGCLQLLPGTHKNMNYDEDKIMEYAPTKVNQMEKDGSRRGFFGYDYRELQIDSAFKPDESKAFPLVMKAGQFVIFWSTLMHASLPHTGSLRDTRVGYATRYVPTKVHVYPETEFVVEYGGTIPLEKYGAVLVAGENKFNYNKLVTSNTRGTPFVVK